MWRQEELWGRSVQSGLTALTINGNFDGKFQSVLGNNLTLAMETAVDVQHKGQNHMGVKNIGYDLSCDVLPVT